MNTYRVKFKKIDQATAFIQELSESLLIQDLNLFYANLQNCVVTVKVTEEYGPIAEVASFHSCISCEGVR
jgi:hypothetical protein